MNNSVKVRVTAIVLLALAVFASCFPVVFANETETDTDGHNSGQPLISTKSGSAFQGFYRIKNLQNGKYLSLSMTDGELTVTTLKSDTGSASQYFRFLYAENNRYILNSAYDGAEYAISAIKTSHKSDCARKFTDEDGLKITEYAAAASLIDSAVLLSVLNDTESDCVSLSTGTEQGEVLYLVNGEKLTFTSLPDIAFQWQLEEVKVSSLSMAYFETRIKLYSVRKFCAKVLPAALSSFIEWSVDNEDVMLVSEDGTICALSEGESNLTASVGNTRYTCSVEVCDSDAFAWFSQENVTNSYWNGGALSGIKFYGKQFASSGSWDWMREGCALTSCAMLFCNLGATYTNGYDFRSDQKGDLPADPYTLALANIGHTGFTSPTINYRSDPVLVRWANITNAFKVDGRSLSYYQKYTSNLGYIRDALAIHPEGVVVRMVKSNGDTHFVLFTECINPGESNSSKLKFIVYDPMSYDGSDGDGVPFEKSASYKDGYRYSNISSVIMWNVH